jgi:tRNA threonylcarbamoyl adenosine modification protein (Sua5/YciO/YrdC/YwlC family)
MAVIDLEPALAALARGEVVGLPTDTVYGIGADPWRKDAVARLFAVKQRPEVKPIPILAANVESLAGIAVLGERARAAGERHWPGPLTLVVFRAPGSPEWIGDPTAGSVAVRIPDHPAALALLRRWGPLAVTSANLSGEAPVLDDEGASAILGADVAVYLPGVAAGAVASTVARITDRGVSVLRRGPISEEEL